MLCKIAFAAAVVTAWPVAQAADPGSGVLTGAQSVPSNAVAPHQADATFANYKFRGGGLVVRAVSDGSVGHMSMAPPALWADRARDFARG
jgi:hypothetical protein